MKTVESVYTEKIGVGEKLAYGCGDLASNLVMVLTGTYISFFYTDALGLNVGIVGTLILISRFFDGFTDIIMGFIMDKTKSKHGKARAWMLWLAIPFGVCTALLTMVPDLGNVGKYIYVFISYNVVTTFLYTAINIPYGALNSLMTRDQTQRESINVFRMTMAQIGGLIINACTLPFINAVGGSTNQSSWMIVSSVYGFIAAALFLLCFAKTKERVNVVSDEDRKIGFIKTLKLMMKNDAWLLICAIWIVNILGMAIGMGVGVYYAKYILHNEAYFGFLAVIQQGVSIVLMAMMMPFVKRFGKRNVALVGTIISLISQLLIIVNPASFSWLVVCNIVKGIGSAPLMATLFAMMADSIEYGHWKTGVRIEGTLYSATTFGAKVGGGVGMVAATTVLGMAGYNGALAVQSESALRAISNLYIYAPIIFLVILPILYCFYKLDKQYPQVIKELTERENKNK
ncbi:MFS transporter [Clostridium sp. NSJ-6]|uniref:MFS transporter n=1 Tax=Clostridium hominis TaxID=2763036 RepID=A0ABR7DGZ4_9CLOT|nr:MFS transporter [Clostridium hominis]MBC5630674.1 MFS transporter [Clostridium hominis]MDU2670454.1 MFS transporter [Clostridium sp.]